MAQQSMSHECKGTTLDESQFLCHDMSLMTEHSMSLESNGTTLDEWHECNGTTLDE